MTEPLEQTNPGAVDESGGKRLPWRTFAIIAVAGAGGGLAGMLAVKGLLAAKGLAATHLALGAKGAAANAASAANAADVSLAGLAPHGQAALGTLAPSAAAPLAPGAAGWTGKLSAFIDKLAQNPFAAAATGAAGGGAAGFGVAERNIAGLREQVQEQATAADALRQETAQIKTSLRETRAAGKPRNPAPAGGDRLEDIRGIGGVYADRLRAAGVTGFAELAALPPDRVKEIVGHGTALSIQSWIKEAEALAKGGPLKTNGN